MKANLRGTRAQQGMIDRAVAGTHPDTRAFLIHLTASLQTPIRHGNPDPTVPIPSKFIQEHCREAEIDTLIDAGVIRATPYDREGARCREYGFDVTWLDTFIDNGPSTSAALQYQFVNLATGRPDNRSRPRSRLSRTNDGSKAPDLSVGAAKVIRSSWFNAVAIEEHLAGMKDEISTSVSVEEVMSAKARYRADRTCYAVILDGASPVDAADGLVLWSYRPAYRVQRFGRLTEIGGGLQSCSREMKRAARQGVPDWHNYDLSASQARLLVVLMERAEIEAKWLRAYLKDPQAKVTWAGKVGLSVDAWKRVFYALLMGGHAPSVSQIGFSDGAIVKAILENVGEDALAETYRRFLAATNSLRDQLQAWHDHLVDSWAMSGYFVGANGKTYLKNAAGSIVALEDLSPEGKRHELAAKLAAFQLQGIEASVVHRIAIAGPDNGFNVMSHEHDGLVTRGAIPDEVVKAAAQAAGVPLEAVELVEKSFV